MLRSRLTCCRYVAESGDSLSIIATSFVVDLVELQVRGCIAPAKVSAPVTGVVTVLPQQPGAHREGFELVALCARAALCVCADTPIETAPANVAGAE